jgi:hypothetical protein
MSTGTAGSRITHESDPFLEPDKQAAQKSDEVRTTLPRGFEERKETALFKFERPGTMLEGHIAGFMRITLEGKPAVGIYFALNEKTDQFVKVHATRQLLEKIHTTDAGRRARITYQGENETLKTAGNKMRNFSVQIDTKSEPRTDLLLDTSLLEMLQDES